MTQPRPYFEITATDLVVPPIHQGIMTHRCCKTEGCPPAPVIEHHRPLPVAENYADVVAPNRTVDSDPTNPKPCCILCATWVCHGCWNFRRGGASRQPAGPAGPGGAWCPWCGGTGGQFIATRHRKPHERALQLPYLVPLFGA